MAYLPETFIYDEEDEEKTCRSVVTCAWLLFYKGLPAGELNDVAAGVSSADEEWLMRILFDLVFFIWIGILLFNIIMGLMLDTFAALREDAENRQDILDNQCFVCGFERKVYEDKGILDPPFDTHKNKDHNKWSYLHFVIYLRKKNKSDYTGVESAVSKSLDNDDVSWVPVRNSFALSHFNLGDKDPMTIEELSDKIDACLGMIAQLKGDAKEAPEAAE